MISWAQQQRERRDGANLIPDESAANDDNSELRSAEIPALPSVEPEDDDLPPIQFGLKSLLVWTTLACAAFAVVSRLSMLGAVALVWLFLLMAAHVSGNAWGSRATARSTRRHLAGTGDRAVAGTVRRLPPPCAPQTHLGLQAKLGHGMAVMVAIGAVIGAGLGLSLIWRHNQGGLGPTGVLMGAFSSAGIGAFLSFLAFSCLKVASKALRQAAGSSAEKVGPVSSSDS
jgi:hypothetical protein